MEEKQNFVLCGEKKKRLLIPDGYKLVTDRSDLSITKDNINNYKVANIRKYFWMDLEDDDIDCPGHVLGDHLIEKINN